MRFLLFALLMAFHASATAQQGILRWAYGPFATPGDAAFVIEGHRIFQACGAFGSLGPCLYVIDDDDTVWHAEDAFGRKGFCAFIAEGDRLQRCQGTLGSKGSCALLLEGHKVFRADGPFCNKQEGAFVLDGNAIYLAEGPFAMKGDAILMVDGDVPMIALLTILAGL